MHRVKHLFRRSYHVGKARTGRLHRHPATLPILLFVTLVLVGAGVLAFGLKRNAKQLTITPNENYIVILRVDGQKRVVPTNADTVGELLDRLHVKLASGDRVEPAASAPIAVDNFLVNVYRSSPVTIVDGVQQLSTANAAATPRSMVTEAGVQLYPEDTVTSVPGDNFVTDKSIGNRVVISRAVPVTVSLYSGAPVTIRTHAATVGDWAKAAKITLSKDDTLKPAADTPIASGMQIAVVRNGIHTVTQVAAIPAPVKTLIDMSLSFGSQAVRQEGSAGQETRTYQVVVQNGEEVSRTLIQRVVTVQPVERIVAKGNTVNIPANKQAVMAAAGVSPSDYAYVDYIFSRESHWNAAALNARGCGGLGQACPSAKLQASCPNWQTDPVCQTRWFSGYAGRYGGWAGAYNAWLKKGWW